eukprot:ANDGO_05196.mRNA.1 hypothetical protein
MEDRKFMQNIRSCLENFEQRSELQMFPWFPKADQTILGKFGDSHPSKFLDLVKFHDLDGDEDALFPLDFPQPNEDAQNALLGYAESDILTYRDVSVFLRSYASRRADVRERDPKQKLGDATALGIVVSELRFRVEYMCHMKHVLSHGFLQLASELRSECIESGFMDDKLYVQDVALLSKCVPLFWAPPPMASLVQLNIAMDSHGDVSHVLFFESDASQLEFMNVCRHRLTTAARREAIAKFSCVHGPSGYARLICHPMVLDAILSFTSACAEEASPVSESLSLVQNAEWLRGHVESFDDVRASACRLEVARLEKLSGAQQSLVNSRPSGGAQSSRMVAETGVMIEGFAKNDDLALKLSVISKRLQTALQTVLQTPSER